LVEFEPGRIPGFAFFAMQDELSDLLSLYFRDQVEAEAEIPYVAD
jgi:hypothetical protein